MLNQTASLTLLSVPMYRRARIIFNDDIGCTDIPDDIREYNIKEVLEDEALAAIRTAFGDKAFE